MIVNFFGKLESPEASSQINVSEINYREEFIDPIYRQVLNVFKENVEGEGKLQGLFWSDWDFDGVLSRYGVGTKSSTWNMIKFYTRILADYLVVDDQAEITEECEFLRNVTEVSVAPRQQSQPETCCDSTCGAMFGYLTGTDYKNVGLTFSAEACCEQCQKDRRCDGWSWCTCAGGCQLPDLQLSYSERVCLLKQLPSSRFAMNITDGEYGSWLSGIPLRNQSRNAKVTEEGQLVRDFVYHSECQISGPCGRNTKECSERQIDNSIRCPSQECNAQQVNYNVDVVSVIDLNSNAPGVPITTVDQCCRACSVHADCNLFTFCNSPYGCATGCPGEFEDDFGPYRQCQGGKWPSWQCQLKYYNGTGKFDLVEAGELQPWISGYLDWKEIS
eukprot:TRINITY_DN27774_c0_g1_i1.p1 TRINITY_DN27774_c0_g1~~TRINITY_DN27774_c0_g1_i1.p1  ORF type:complete len:388 (-),score=23.68 TRINITY_DN27774_c0_g1_i1:347-1510(-)